jgi:hypothetical protein
VPPLASGQDVKAGGEAEADPGDEAVGEAHAGEVDAAVAAQPRADGVVRRDERPRRIVERRRRP